MQATVQQYNTIRENESGLLTYKQYGDKFWLVDFKPDLQNQFPNQ